MAKKRCAHRELVVKTEKDRCNWVLCKGCKKRGPKKHSVMLAIMAFGMAITSWNAKYD